MKERLLLTPPAPCGGYQGEAAPTQEISPWASWPVKLREEAIQASEALLLQKKQWLKQILLRYQGPVGRSGMLKLLKETEACVAQSKVPVQKRVFTVAEEILSNMLHYGAFEEHPANTDRYTVEGTFVLAQNSHSYTLMSRNRCELAAGKVHELAGDIHERLVRRNSEDKAGLKELYRHIISNGSLCGDSNRGSGLGFVSIARKSDAAIQYAFEPLTEKEMYFSIMVNISK